ncbi:ABC transporter, ATP-binding protein [Actinomyces graevenitzii F0530]|uniref:ABC transporter, ATP-binding protein n=1 Tax=Actinomyces graevenitzii F0530 TaxID=1321817 RepID=U1PVM9_9ACTO|nr:ATP-binding cassette domain-containing protein [Actinomyces graevenitzii]ERH14526.1 ABC transporter, ATP-binding protein [Actinomyces graevenitzii F0530]
MISFENTCCSGLEGTCLSFAPASVSSIIGDGASAKDAILTLLNRRRRPTQGKVSGLPDSAQIGYMPSDSGTWPNLSVAENLRFVAKIFGHYDDARAQQLLKAADLDRFTDRLARNLSGGMRKKLGVIMAALPEPQLLVLDEPTTGVDPDSRTAILALIKAEAARGATVVVATTYIDEAEDSSQIILTLGSRVMATGTAKQLITCAPKLDEQTVASLGEPWQRSAPLERACIAWQLSTQASSDWQGFSAELGQSSQAGTSDSVPAQPANSTQPQPTSSTQAGSGKSATAPSPKAQDLISVHELRKRFGDFEALKGVSFAVSPGEIVGLIGANGAGKSTSMRIILGLEAASSGQVSVLGQRPGSLQARKLLGYVPQFVGLAPSLSASENLIFNARQYQCQVPTQVGRWASSFGANPVANLPLSTRRMLACMNATMHAPQLLIMDEPTSGMDPLARLRLWQYLRQLASNGVGILISTHYSSEAAQCDRVVRMRAGQVI